MKPTQLLNRPKRRVRNLGNLLITGLIFLFLTSCKNNDRGLVVGKIKKAAKLATTEFTVDKIVYGVKRKKLAWVVNLNEAKFIAHSEAIIKTGIDLQKLKKDDIKINGKEISINLPPVEVINFSYPAERFRMDTIVSGNAFLNKISLYDQEEYFQDAEIDIQNNLKYMGIVETTEKKTTIMLENLLRNLGYNEIYISYRKGVLIPQITGGTE